MIEEENYMFEFEFSIEKYKFQAAKVLEADTRLALLRNEIVPKL